MTAGELTLIDDHIVVACPGGEAMPLLNGPDQLASWFRAGRNETSTTITSDLGDCVLVRTCERWEPSDQVLTVDGSIEGVAVHAHLTILAVVHSISDGRVHEGTEIWVHVELGRGAGARRIARIITAAITRGLEHLRLELERSPNSE